MTITPSPCHVFIEYAEPAAVRGHVVIPDTVKPEERNGGRIVAVADCYRTKKGTEIPMTSRVGQYAVFRPRSADVFSVRGVTYFNVHEDDLLLVTDSLEEFQKLTSTT